MEEPYVGTHIVQFTDTFDDDAKTKLESAYTLHTGEHGLDHWNLGIRPAVNSIEIGAKLSEFITNTERAERLIASVNYAPPSKKEGTEDNARNDFFCAVLDDDTVVCGTCNGLEFSYIKSHIKEFYRLKNTNHKGSQFRSLEVLPKYAVKFSIKEDRERLIQKGQTDPACGEPYLERIENFNEFIPDVPDATHVFQVDNFKNVKLYVSDNDRKLLEELSQKKSPIHFAFGKAASEVTGKRSLRQALGKTYESAQRLVFGKDPRVKFSGLYEGVASTSFFSAPIGTNIVTVNSSSKLIDGWSVPMIATLRYLPAETLPAYKKDVPKVGDLVFLSGKRPSTFAWLKARYIGLKRAPIA